MVDCRRSDDLVLRPDDDVLDIFKLFDFADERNHYLRPTTGRSAMTLLH
jgi:hypothetical protein